MEIGEYFLGNSKKARKVLLEKLSRPELIKLIGEDLYSEISSFLDNIYSNSPDDQELEIYKKKNIVKLLLSFASKGELHGASFWKGVISRMEKDVIDKAARDGLDFSRTGKGLVDECLRYEFKRNGLPFVDYSEKTNIRPAIQVCEAPVSPFKSLKNFQISVSQRADILLKIPRSRFIVQMPTGSGKTRTAMEVIASRLNSAENVTNVIWLAHSVDLIEQSATCFEEVWNHIGQKDVQLRILDGSRAGLEKFESDSCFIVSTFQSRISYSNSRGGDFETIVGRTTLVVCDEAHMSIAPAYRARVSKLLSKGSSLVGLTATPGRNADDDAGNQNLSDFYFNRIINLEVPENETVFEYLRSIGVMAYAKTQRIAGSNLKLGAREVRKIQEEFSIPKEILNQLAQEELRNIEIIVKLKELITKEERNSIILFACSVDHSKFISSVCIYLGINAAHVDGNTPPAERQSLLRRFREGEIQLLTNFGVLATGFDAPRTEVVFIARPTNSIVLYSQMIGRGLRGPAIGGTSDCTIVNVVDNITGLPKPDDIYDYFAGYFQN